MEFSESCETVLLMGDFLCRILSHVLLLLVAFGEKLNLEILVLFLRNVAFLKTGLKTHFPSPP